MKKAIRALAIFAYSILNKGYTFDLYFFIRIMFFVSSQTFTANRVALLLALIFTSPFCFAQSPGNVGTTNLTAWFKADSISTGSIQYWNSSYPKGAGTVVLSDTTGSPFPQVVNAGGLLNYNAAISYAGNASTNVLMLGKLGTVNFLDNNASTAQGSFIMVYYLPTYTATGGHMMHYRESNSDGIQFRHLGANTRFAIGSTTTSVNASRDHAEDYKPMIYSYTGNRSSTTSMSAFKRGKLFTGGAASGTSGDNGIIAGARISGGVYAGFFEGYIAEFMFYNRTITVAELDKIHTYLALKYGITLDNTGGGTQGNYTAPGGKIIWNAAINSTYHNGVIGIGREDAESFCQKQSHTQDDSVRLYLNYVAANNELNFNTFSNDSSYIVMGHNGGMLRATASSYAEIPSSSGVISRIDREWKVQNTNFPGLFNIDVKIDSLGNPAQLNASDIVLLVDDDGDFSNAATYSSTSGLYITVSSGTISITGIGNTHIPMDSVRYITIGSNNVNTPLPVKFVKITAGKTADGNLITWQTASEVNNKYFTVQKSVNGNAFTDFTVVYAVKNSSRLNTYSVIDREAFEPEDVVWYRVKQTDIDGHFIYSQAVKAEGEGELALEVFPTYTNQYLQISHVKNVFDTFKVINLQGQDLYKETRLVHESGGDYTLDVESLSPGYYILMIGEEQIRFMKY